MFSDHHLESTPPLLPIRLVLPLPAGHFSTFDEEATLFLFFVPCSRRLDVVCVLISRVTQRSISIASYALRVFDSIPPHDRVFYEVYPKVHPRSHLIFCIVFLSWILPIFLDPLQPRFLYATCVQLRLYRDNGDFACARWVRSPRGWKLDVRKLIHPTLCYGHS